MRHRTISVSGVVVVIYVLGTMQAVLGQEASPQGDFQNSLDQGESLFAQSRLSEAEAAYQEAVRLEPKSSKARYRLGMVAYMQGNDDLALESFKKTIQYDRKKANGHIGLGMVYLRMSNRRLDARKALRTAVKLDPENARAPYYLGLTFMDVPRYDALIGSERDGRNYFQKVIAIDSLHQDAYYQLARCFEEADPPDYRKAMRFFIQQLSVYPDHAQAFDHFMEVCLRSERFTDGAALLEQLSLTLGDTAPAYMKKSMEQFRAFASINQGDAGQAMQAFETYLAGLSESERSLYTDLVHVASPAAYQDYLKLNETDRDVYVRTFWASRDPNPATVVNERLLEHYRRVLYARTQFSHGKQLWDRRGEIYIRYGEPDDRRRFLYAGDDPYDSFQSSGNSEVDIIREMNLQLGYQLKVDRGQVTSLLKIDRAKRKGFGAESISPEVEDQ